MKLIAITASERKNGNSVLAAKYVSKKLPADLEIINLAIKEIKPCKACYACLYGEECRIDDDVYEIYDRIAEADRVLITSPVYWLDATGKLKTFIDRGFMALPYLYKFATKKVAAITIHGFEEMKGWASATHNILARVLGLNLLASVEIHAALPGEILLKKENIEKLNLVVSALRDGKRIVAQDQCPICLNATFRAGENKLICLICNSELDLNLNVLRKRDAFSDHIWLSEHYEVLKSMMEAFKRMIGELRGAKERVLNDDI